MEERLAPGEHIVIDDNTQELKPGYRERMDKALGNNGFVRVIRSLGKPLFNVGKAVVGPVAGSIVDLAVAAAKAISQELNHNEIQGNLQPAVADGIEMDR